MEKRITSTHRGRRPWSSFGAVCPGKCANGKTYINREDESGSTCTVCGGTGMVADDELAAWNQDPAYTRSIGESGPDSYTGFYKKAFVSRVKGEAARGGLEALRPMTLKGFVAQRRADQNVHPIDAKFIREDIRAADIRLRCPAECNGGHHAIRNDEDTRFKCTVCAQYGGSGTIPATALAEWMSDPQYRAYYESLGYVKSQMVPYDAWKRGTAPVPVVASLPKAPKAPKAPTTMRKLISWVSNTLGPDARREKPKGPWPARPVDDPSVASLCAVCLAREKTTAFTPCGHFGFCDTCAAGLYMCPECGAQGTPIRIHNVARTGAPVER